ncbi:lachrymatory-factor synthase isoform X2 [Cajanus cajan]|uniref:lachrymatory-factor synthase isoform X2 n=1 Tax=Cajanus cajan TaxID=3821 RepID=UPI00098D7CDA|nr:lachrymatory-factor synthase isoform X2 [Cajanus cajan]
MNLRLPHKPSSQDLFCCTPSPLTTHQSLLVCTKMEHELHERWEGKVSAKLRNATKEQAWPLVKDFFNLHKRFPTLATCYGIHGSNGEPGCIRYCAGSSIPSKSNASGSVSWSKERLVVVDDVDFSLKYEMVDGNIGFRSYESTMKVLSDDDSDGCMLEWSFAVDPVEGLLLQDLVTKYHVGLQLMAHKMEDEIQGLVTGIM